MWRDGAGEERSVMRRCPVLYRDAYNGAQRYSAVWRVRLKSNDELREELGWNRSVIASRLGNMDSPLRNRWHTSRDRSRRCNDMCGEEASSPLRTSTPSTVKDSLLR